MLSYHVYLAYKNCMYLQLISAENKMVHLSDVRKIFSPKFEFRPKHE